METIMSLLSSLSAASPEGSTRVILVRHGRSTFNQLKLYQGSSDTSVLTEAGYEMAGQVGRYLAHQTIDAIYTSPLKRVQQTVDAILEQLGSGVRRLEIHSGLREIDMHTWEGRSFQAVQQFEPDAYQCWKQRPDEFRMISQASSAVSSRRAGAVATAVQPCYPVLDLYERVRQFWQEILPLHCGQTILIVSHGGTNRALISTALGLPPARFHSLQQSNCGISMLAFPEGDLQSGHLDTLNLTTPAGEILPKLKEGKHGLRLLLLPTESTDASISHLAELLNTTPIDFSLAHTAARAQTLTDQVLKDHPQTVRLQSQHQQFLQHWQRTLAAKSSHSPQLITGLVVAQTADIQQALAEITGLKLQQKLLIQPGCLSILHYPTANHSPVIQALNFG
jgi:phosphoserine phosphatase